MSLQQTGDPVPTLNDLSPDIVDEARRLRSQSVGVVVKYLRRFVPNMGLADAEDFINDVLIGKQDAKSWKMRDCLMFPTPHDPGRLFAKSYWDGLKGEGADYLRVRPASWIHPSDPIAGAVGVLKRGVRYWETEPAGYIYFFFGSLHTLEPIAAGDVDMYARRWLAHVLACWTTAYREAQGAQATADGLLGAIPELAELEVTDDARVSATALAREMATFSGSPNFTKQAGFLGPEEWYLR